MIWNSFSALTHIFLKYTTGTIFTTIAKIFKHVCGLISCNFFDSNCKRLL